ncbi:MAG: hypothetical protein D6723_18235, partial [Acidobacteria bacterium]
REAAAAFRVVYEVVRGEEVVWRGVVERRAMGRPVMVSWPLPLARLTPGHYVLRVRVRAVRSRQHVMRQIEFTVKT